MAVNSSLSTDPNTPSIANGMGNTNPVAKRESNDRLLIKKMLAHKHMIETIERFEWKNLPPSIPADLIERVLYFRFKGAMFKFNERFIFLPFTLKGTIDSYGRYISITPVLFTGQWKMAGDGTTTKDIAFMSGQSYKVIYDLEEEDQDMIGKGDLEEEDFDADDDLGEDKAVILTDSTLEVSQDYTPMNYLIRPLIEQLTDILVLVNIDLITSAKIWVVVAKDPEQKDAIENEFRNLDRQILENGKRVVVVTSSTDLKELAGSSSKDSARYFQSYQSIDNLRKDIIGAENGGTFMKQEHTTEMETETNTSSSSFVLNNALRMRKEFCAMVNKTFDLNIDVEVKSTEQTSIVASEGAQSIDRKGDEA